MQLTWMQINGSLAKPKFSSRTPNRLVSKLDLILLYLEVNAVKIDVKVIVYGVAAVVLCC